MGERRLERRKEVNQGVELKRDGTGTHSLLEAHSSVLWGLPQGVGQGPPGL